MAEVVFTNVTSGASSISVRGKMLVEDRPRQDYKTIVLRPDQSVSDLDFVRVVHILTMWRMAHMANTSPICLTETRRETQSEREFGEQKEAFEKIPPLFLEPYRNKFIACRDGKIVDSDEDFAVLVRRFFGTYGDVPVYITKVGEDEPIVIDTPL